MGQYAGFWNPQTPTGPVHYASALTFCPFALSFFVAFFSTLKKRPLDDYRRPKRSIVANLAPKTTPKRRSKWSQIEDCRPSRNMRLRVRIAYLPLPGEVLFCSESSSPKKYTKKRLRKPPCRQKSQFGVPECEKMRRKMDQTLMT